MQLDTLGRDNSTIAVWVADAYEPTKKIREKELWDTVEASIVAGTGQKNYTTINKQSN